MALTNNQLELIQAVTKNNLRTAKKAALACLNEDTSKKNEHAVAYYKRVLSNTPTEIKLPPNLSGYASLETLDNYNPNRYFLSDKEQPLLQTIQKMHDVSLKLMEKQIGYLNATLLYGESGVGKTAFSRYVAWRLKMPYLYVNFSALISSLLGNTAQNIINLFNFIKQNQCLVMLDEIDSIAAKRQYGDGAESELARSTTTLIQMLDSIPNDRVILAATNLYDSVDLAILRRFTVRHEMIRLTSEEKSAFIRQFFSDIDIMYDATSADCYAKNDVTQAALYNHMVQSIADMMMKGTDKTVL